MLKEKNKFRFQLQQVGSYLSGMIMPNIGVFITWGLITALFIPTGWFPNLQIATIIEPTMIYLMPILIGYTGGKLVYGARGAVVASMATMGLIVGSDIPMLLGAMIMGPIAAWLLKSFDKQIKGKVPTGFEMLVNNFSAGLLGTVLAIVSLLVVGSAVESLNRFMATGINFLVQHQLLPLVSILVEPGKILFLNNAINHVALGPIGIKEASETGKSILFLIEANPGPGLGILLAYTFFGKESLKQTAAGAIIIQFFGGIHEIYFPYLLMNPVLIISAVFGGMAGVLSFSIFNVGLVGPASPGSILAILTLTSRGDYLGIFVGIVVSASTSFMISMLIIRFLKIKNPVETVVENRMSELKIGKKTQKKETELITERVTKEHTVEFPKVINKIIFVCNIGIGSSAMGASILRKKMQEMDLELQVIHLSLEQLVGDEETIIITQQELTPQAIKKAPNAYHFSVNNFMKNKEYAEIIERLTAKRRVKDVPIS